MVIGSTLHSFEGGSPGCDEAADDAAFRSAPGSRGYGEKQLCTWALGGERDGAYLGETPEPLGYRSWAGRHRIHMQHDGGASASFRWFVDGCAFVRISSAVLVQTNGWVRSFQPLMKARILALRSLTEVKIPRRMAWRSRMGEPDLDEVEPGAGGRDEVHLESGVGGQPGLDIGGLRVA